MNFHGTFGMDQMWKSCLLFPMLFLLLIYPHFRSTLLSFSVAYPSIASCTIDLIEDRKAHCQMIQLLDAQIREAAVCMLPCCFICRCLRSAISAKILAH